VLEYCENKPKFVVDKAPWLVQFGESWIGVLASNLSVREVRLNPCFLR